MQRAFPHSTRLRVNWSESKNSMKQRVVGQDRECLPVNPLILKKPCSWANRFFKTEGFVDKHSLTHSNNHCFDITFLPLLQNAEKLSVQERLLCKLVIFQVTHYVTRVINKLSLS